MVTMIGSTGGATSQPLKIMSVHFTKASKSDQCVVVFGVHDVFS